MAVAVAVVVAAAAAAAVDTKKRTSLFADAYFSEEMT
jgi:hypothetical protein